MITEHTDMKKHLLIIGWGYTAKYLAKALDASQWTVTATTRQINSVESLNDTITLIPYQLDAIEQPIQRCTHCLITAPCLSHDHDTVLELCRELLLQPLPSLQWVGYLSSTSVYGDHQGNWVNEQSELLTHESRGLQRIRAEQHWLDLFNQRQVPIHIFRLAGIYGPQRNAIDNIRRGKQACVVKPHQVFSRIHVEDIARALVCSFDQPTPGTVYNLADDSPSSPESVYDFACSLLNRPPLTHRVFNSQLESEMVNSFYSSCRRVSNATFKQQFNFQLRYPSYEEGLKALHINAQPLD